MSQTAALISHSHPPAATEAVAIAAEVGRARPAGAWSPPPMSSPSTARPRRGSRKPTCRRRGRPLPGARRRRLDPLRAAPLRRHAASPSSASTSAPSASSPRSSATRPRRGSGGRSRARPRRSTCPGLEIEIDGSATSPLNDVSFSRRPEDRVAELSYKIAGEEVGHVRCDGLVAATPVGSTGYNLANQGPILAWGVKGYVVSYISPHSLTARALVVAPADVLHVGNAAGREPVDVAVDGDQVGELEPGDALEVRFVDVGQLPRAAARNELLPADPREVRPPRRLSRGSRGRSVL